MKITCKDKSVEIPNLLVFVGLLVVDSVAANICRVQVSKRNRNKGES